ncbi:MULTISPECIES: copper chaperone PCu(A)C [unclassified Moritella]|uniref:copper chaperone PCu(A)C n=1 Tax=unclassified Moritella TaxID=2637987 RepID=UPI001BA544A2|nr:MULTISPECIES: copper chaperone PCu(A)C [unclassified Moritella]QUM86847.1 copper chaperone PCu(A)C [Moritella sp. 28]QUM91072.1 copper chaperone PCu(A)C [Moritella sp. 36]
MQKSIITTLIATAILSAAPTFAAEKTNMMIMDAWVRAAPPSAKVQAAFFTVMNHSDKPIVITDVEAQGFGRSELHLSGKKDGMMTMQKQQKVTIPANAVFKFKPGSYHVMLLEPNKIAAPGELVNVSFTLLNGEKISTKMPVKRDNSKTKMDHTNMKHN